MATIRKIARLLDMMRNIYDLSFCGGCNREKKTEEKSETQEDKTSEEKTEEDEETVEQIFDTLSEKQKNVIYAMFGQAIRGTG
ncbi:MAG: hypothetical protein ACLT76_09320 [Clostridium fessum]